jgi:adenylate kinase
MNKPNKVAWIRGGRAVCANPPEPQPEPPWHLVLLGAPGVGKGAQSEILCARLGACHLSTGDVLRAAECQTGAARTKALASAIFSMQRGDLVPDETMLDLLKERGRCLRCCGGFVLDGFPRTVPQAVGLDELLKREGVTLDAVFSYELPIDEIVERLGGRWVCPECKAVYHETKQPPIEKGVCDACGGRLVRRADDQPEAIRTRIRAYEEKIGPLLEWYARKNLLIRVPAYGSPEEIYARTWTCGRTLHAPAGAS